MIRRTSKPEVKPRATGKRVSPGRPIERQSKFSAETIDALRNDLMQQKIPLSQIVISDEDQPGLRAIIRQSGTVTFNVQYKITGQKDYRPQIKIGDYPEMNVYRARGIARTIVELGHRGIDPTAGLHERLIRELEEKGVSWTP